MTQMNIHHRGALALYLPSQLLPVLLSKLNKWNKYFFLVFYVVTKSTANFLLFMLTFSGTSLMNVGHMNSVVFCAAPTFIYEMVITIEHSVIDERIIDMQHETNV